MSKDELEKDKIKTFANDLIQKYPNITYRIYSSIEYGDKKIYNIQNQKKEKQLYNLIIGTNKTKISSAQFVGRQLNSEYRENCSNYVMISLYGNWAEEDMFILKI